MKLDFATLAFGYTVLAGGGTPNWATSLGQSKAKKYRINDDPSINEMLKGMTYCAVPVTSVSTKIGKGGAEVSGKQEGNPIVSAAVFSNVYINETPIYNSKFILLITKDTSASHSGRLRFKYGPSNKYTSPEGVYTNEMFFAKARKQLELADDACFFVSEISVVNQSDLVLKTFIVNKYHSVEYADGAALRSAWEELADFNIETPEDETHDSTPTADLFTLIKEKYATGDYPHQDKESLEATYAKFKSLYGKEALKAMNGKTLLYRLFGTKEQDNLSLTYVAERGKDYANFGSCRGAYGWANVITCFQGTQWQYCTSAADITNITEDEAVEKAELLVGDLILALEIIEDYAAKNKLTTTEGYEELDAELKEVLGDLYNKPRFKKHLSLLYPDLFMNTFDSATKKDGLTNRIFTLLQLDLSGNWYTQSGRFSALAQTLGIPNLDLYLIMESILGEGVKSPVGECEDVDEIPDDYAENEKKFREWMAAQTSHKGILCSASMISKNCRALTKVCEMMDIDEYPDLKSIFQITDMDLFVEVKDIIKAHPDYDDVDKACSNRYLTSGLKWYTRYLDEMFSITPEIVDTPADPYDKAKFLADVFMTEEQYERLKKLLFYKGNVILQGAPGVGKTYLAKKFAYSILGEKNDKYIEMVQFHQNYSYEDFIMGYKPIDDGFELKNGIFYNFCKKAEAAPGKKFFFIIDEINRGNLSKIFGELMMLIEGDKRGQSHSIKLAYRNELFSVPENLYIIGMMNTADRSLAMMDYALRRRFSFFDVEPAFDKTAFKPHLTKYVSAAMADKVISRFKELNKKISDENNSGLGKGYCIGHSYFCVPPVTGQSDDEWYNSIIEFEIMPLLYEYWWDDKEKAEDCIKALQK